MIPLDRQSAHANAVVAEYDGGTLIQVVCDLGEIGEQEHGLALWTTGYFASKQHHTGLPRSREGEERTEVGVEVNSTR